MSSFDENGHATDLSSQGRHLTYNGNPTYNAAGLAPYIDFDGTGDYLSRLDETGLDILGTESYVALPGLTMGGWFWPSNLASSNQSFMSKRTPSAGTYSYYLTTALTTLHGGISTDGNATVGAQSTIAADVWQFWVLRFTPGTEVALFVNDSKNTNTSGIPSSIFNSSAGFAIGAYGSGGEFPATGRASLCFLCAAAVPDATIEELYQTSRGLFEV